MSCTRRILHILRFSTWNYPGAADAAGRRAARRRLRFVCCLSAVTALLFSSLSLCRAQIAPASSRPILLLAVPGLRAEDLDSARLPALQTLRAGGAAGWMVCRAARVSDRRMLAPDGRDTSASLALTLGSGSRAVAVMEGGGKGRGRETGLFDSEARLSSSYQTSLRQANGALDHVAPLGALGDLIHRAGGNIRLIGSATPDGSADLDSLLLAMDATGRVDAAETNLLRDEAQNAFPFGLRDDVPALLRGLQAPLPPRSLLVLTFGDLSRADQYAPLCLPAQRDRQRDAALRQLNALLAGLLEARQAARRQRAAGPSAHDTQARERPDSVSAPRDGTRPPDTPAADFQRLYILSPAPAASTEPLDRLAPILMYGDDIAPGLVASPSTRGVGIVVNTDLLPTLAAELGLPPPPGNVGRALHYQTAEASGLTLSEWRAAHDRLLRSERLKHIYGGLPTIQALLALAVWACVKWKRRRIACALGLILPALPLGMLLLPAVPFVSASPPAAGTALFAFALLFSALAWRIYPDPLAPLRLLRGMLAVLLFFIVADLLCASPLLRQAWMSYSVMETARFYGIGNEYMGAVIGAACILSGAVKKKISKEEKKIRVGERSLSFLKSNPVNPANPVNPVYSALLYFFLSSFLLFVLAYNRFGAKVGAVPSAGLALGVEALLLWRGRVRARDIAALCGLALLALGALAWVDSLRSAGEQSHLARAVAGSGAGLLAIAQRKLLLEGYLLLHSPWSLTLASAAFCFWQMGKGQGTGNREQGTDKETRRQGDKEKIGRIGTLDQVDTATEGEAQDDHRNNREAKAIRGGLIAGAVASVLCNDSGVTAAALIMLFGCAWAIARLPTRDTAE